MRLPSPRLSKQRRSLHRRGATAVEFAIVAPLLFLMFFAAIEFSRGNMLRHTVNQAAYEGARRGMVPGADVADIEAEVARIMEASTAFEYSVTVDPSTITMNTEQVTVQVEAGMDDNSWLGAMFLSGQSFSGACTLKRERYDTASVP